MFADISVRLELDRVLVFFLRAVCGTGFQFRTLLFDEGIHIADEGRASFTYYVYEAPATATYTIALGANPSWEAITVPQNFMENAKTTDGTPVDHIARNMDIRITGTVESSGQPLELKVLVNPWLEEEVEVPPYQ